MNKYTFLLITICIQTVILCSCNKDNNGNSTDEDQEKSEEVVITPDCVLGYGMPTGYDIIPRDDISNLIYDEMLYFAQDVNKVGLYTAQKLSIGSGAMKSSLGKKWVSTRSFDTSMGIYCYRIVDKNTLSRYDVYATTTKPSNDKSIVTNDRDWFAGCDSGKNRYMQATIKNNYGNDVVVYFYKSNVQTKTVKYNITPLEKGNGYYIYAVDNNGKNQVYFEWKDYTDDWYWYCKRIAF